MNRPQATLNGAIWLVLCLLLAACGAAPKGRSGQVTVERTQVISLRWRKKLASNIPDFKVPGFYEVHDRFNPVETGAAAFDNRTGHLFIGAAIGGFYCLRADDGATVWRYDLDDPVGSTPVYDEVRDQVYFGADDGFLYALNARSGRFLWKVDAATELRRDIHLVQDTIFAVTAGGQALAVDPANGEVIWRYQRDPVDGFSATGYADLLIAKGHVVTGFSDGSLVSLDAGVGSVDWVVDLGREALAQAQADDVTLLDVDATPVLSGHTVVAASIAGGTFGIDFGTGSILWSRPEVTMVTGAAVQSDEVFLVRSGNRGMMAIAPSTGNTIRELSFGVGLKLDPVVYDDLLLVSDTEAGLYIISGGTGRVLNRFDMVGGFYAPPAQQGGTMVILGNWSTLFSFWIN